MAENSYPTDELGNKLKVGDLVSFVFKDPSVICQVAEVHPASILSDPKGGVMPLQGRVILQVIVPLAYSADLPKLRGVLALRVPEPDSLTLVKQ
jgi:hypothetical protein